MRFGWPLETLATKQTSLPVWSERQANKAKMEPKDRRDQRGHKALKEMLELTAPTVQQV